MNIPDELHHIGFVIANDDEEFLHAWKRHPGYSLMGWALSPARAHVFQTREHASNVIRLLEYHSKLWILDLFDSPGQFVVSTESRNRPQWLPLMMG